MVPEAGRARLRAMVGTRSEWCVSRQRAWGVPLPIFYHRCQGSVRLCVTCSPACRATDEPLCDDATLDHVIGLVQQHGADCWCHRLRGCVVHCNARRRWSMPVETLLPLQHRAQAADYVKGLDILDVWFDSGTSWRAVLAARTKACCTLPPPRADVPAAERRGGRVSGGLRPASWLVSVLAADAHRKQPNSGMRRAASAMHTHRHGRRPHRSAPS